MHTAKVQPTILQLRKTSISKPATWLAYLLQESHKPFLSAGFIDLGCLKSISALYIHSVFCPSLVEQGFAEFPLNLAVWRERAAAVD